MFVILPIYYTIYNFVGLFFKFDEERRTETWRGALGLGLMDTLIYLIFALYGGLEEADFNEVVWMYAAPVIVVFVTMGMIALHVLMKNDVNFIPPLVTILCFAALFIMSVMLIVWCIREADTNNAEEVSPIMLYIANILMITITLVRSKIKEWDPTFTYRPVFFDDKPILSVLNNKFKDVSHWLEYSLVVSAPLFLTVLIILILCGFNPTGIVTQWTTVHL